MTTPNGNVKWSVFILVIGFFVTILGTVWVKLEKIDDAVSDIRTDVAVIKYNVGIKGSTSLLDRMFK